MESPVDSLSVCRIYRSPDKGDTHFSLLPISCCAPYLSSKRTPERVYTVSAGRGWILDFWGPEKFNFGNYNNSMSVDNSCPVAVTQNQPCSTGLYSLCSSHDERSRQDSGTLLSAYSWRGGFLKVGSREPLWLAVVT